MENKIQREIITTADGSKTIHLPELNEHYHSKHGAINEAKHVFIKSGFDHILSKNASDSLDIMEIGFGTGLNAFITFLEAEKKHLPIHYVGVEAYPITLSEAKLMKYPEVLAVKEKQQIFEVMHQSSWELPVAITSNFKLVKRKQFFVDIIDKNNFDLIYFDAFGARVQPELWTIEIFRKMYVALRYRGVLVTYAAKGSVRRAMQEVGFVVERLPGPPGKREMLRATKVEP
jgi:tRNA U34 5-methylaminomethyl-2-thiouridine-forming methyltransferase MnmC